MNPATDLHIQMKKMIAIAYNDFFLKSLMLTVNSFNVENSLLATTATWTDIKKNTLALKIRANLDRPYIVASTLQKVMKSEIMMQL